MCVFSLFFSYSAPLQKVPVSSLFPSSSAFSFISHTSCKPFSFIYICYASLTVFRLGFSLLLSLPLFVHACLFLSFYIKTEWGRNTHSTECDQNPQGTSLHPTYPSFTRKFKDSVSYFLHASYQYKVFKSSLKMT